MCRLIAETINLELRGEEESQWTQMVLCFLWRFVYFSWFLCRLCALILENIAEYLNNPSFTDIICGSFFCLGKICKKDHLQRLKFEFKLVTTYFSCCSPNPLKYLAFCFCKQHIFHNFHFKRKLKALKQSKCKKLIKRVPKVENLNLKKRIK